MRAVFLRKVTTINELNELLSEYTIEDLKQRSSEVYIVKEIEFSDDEYNDFGDNLIKDRDWITEDDAGYKEGKEKVIKVVNRDTGEFLLIRTEGYKYPRYIGVSV